MREFLLMMKFVAFKIGRSMCTVLAIQALEHGRSLFTRCGRKSCGRDRIGSLHVRHHTGSARLTAVDLLATSPGMQFPFRFTLFVF